MRADNPQRLARRSSVRDGAQREINIAEVMATLMHGVLSQPDQAPDGRLREVVDARSKELLFRKQRKGPSKQSRRGDNLDAGYERILLVVTGELNAVIPIDRSKARRVLDEREIETFSLCKEDITNVPRILEGRPHLRVGTPAQDCELLGAHAR